MAAVPVTLDNLISHVAALRPDAEPLDHLSDAVGVASHLDEQSDAMIGYFVDQARSSGASWSQIGASMGVSKQAAQKRFVARTDFSRFTARARNTLVAAGQLAQAAGADEVEVNHLAGGLGAEPDSLAVRIVRRLGVGDKHLFQLGSAPVTGGYDADPRALRFSEASEAAFRETLKAAVRLGHNYVGTEHLLLGIVAADDELAASLGLNQTLIERALDVEMAEMRLERHVANHPS
jgi:Clp amino terminal domain, pathogenicity island component